MVQKIILEQYNIISLFSIAVISVMFMLYIM